MCAVRASFALQKNLVLLLFFYASSIVVSAQCIFPVQSAAKITFQPQFFGQQYLYSTSAPLLVPYGTGRMYVPSNYPDSMQWNVLNPHNPVTYDRLHRPTDPNNAAYNWGALDKRLAELKQAKVPCVLYVFQDTPDWDTAQTYPYGNMSCDRPGYSCLPPLDLSPTGATPGGAHSSVFNFLAALEAHLHDPATNYLATHADIGILETWNEMHSSLIMNKSETAWYGAYWAGNYDQIRRMVEDARCALTGTGTVHVNGFNASPITCDWKPNGSGTTIIGSPSTVTQLPAHRAVLCNFLYGNLGVTQEGSGICGGPPKPGSNPSGDMAQDLNHGADLVDAVLFHPYTLSDYYQPERVFAKNLPDLIVFLQPNEKLKPLLASEWGARTAVYSPDAQVALLPRETLALAAQGAGLSVWFEYDMPALGLEFIAYDGQKCTQRPGCLNAVGVGDRAVYNWLIAKTLVGCSEPSLMGSSIIKCDLTGPNGYQAQIAWDCAVNTATATASGNGTIQECTDSNYIQTLHCDANSWSNNPQCGATAYTPPFTPGQWRDLAGVVHPYQQNQALSVGAKPIIVETWPSPVTLTPVADAYVNSLTPNSNYGSSTLLKIGGSGQVQTAYLKFDLLSLAGKNVSSAKLRLWVYNGAIGTYSVNSVSSSQWLESSITYLSRPPEGSTVASVTNPTLDTWVEFDVTTSVKANLGKPISFAIASSSSYVLILDARHTTNNKPQLVVR